MSRKITLEVPAELIGDFTEKLTELDLENSITGKNDDDEILVEIIYEKDETSSIDELEEYLEEQKEELETEEEED
jgi:hypothetical protein